MKINEGKIEGQRYIKRVEFSKAVLWKDKQISLNPVIVSKCQDHGVLEIWFEDYKKNERWIISMQDFVHNSTLRLVGQERQFYCPISLFDREIINKIDQKPITNEVRPVQNSIF